jgi:hypothetical protein
MAGNLSEATGRAAGSMESAKNGATRLLRIGGELASKIAAEFEKRSLMARLDHYLPPPQTYRSPAPR